MNREVNSLLLKSNRILGTRLIEAGITTLADLDKANSAFVECVRAKDLRRASLLRILIYEDQSLKESDLFDFTIEKHGLGGIMLDGYAIDYGLVASEDSDVMRATWTIPVDKVQGHWFLASCYYLSDIVRQYWEEKLAGQITWYICPINQMEQFFDDLAGRLALEEHAET